MLISIFKKAPLL